MKKLLTTLILLIVIAVTASCTPVQPEEEFFNVTFGGDYVDNYVVSVQKNGMVQAPALPEDEGKTFLYWATADGKEFDFSKPVTGDVRLYAIWSHEEAPRVYHTVNFYGVDGELIASKRVEEGKAAEAPAVSTSDFFVFDGWDKDFGAITEDTDVFAKERYNGLDASFFEYKMNSDGTYTILGVKKGVILPQMTGGFVKLALPAEYEGAPITAIADGVEKVGAFSRLKIVSAYIPSCYKKIGSYAFYGNPLLSNVTFNEGLEEIGEGAFRATFGEGFMHRGYFANTDANAYVSELTEINLPASLKKIGAYAFDHVGGTFVGGVYMQNAVKLNFAAGSRLEEIGEHAFEGVQIKNIHLPETDSLKIKSYAFAADVYLNWVYTDSYDYPKSITTQITIPQSVNQIGDYAFYGAGVMFSYYNGHCTKVRHAVQFDCGKLELVKVGSHAFDGAKLTGSLDISAQTVGDYAFFGQEFSSIVLDDVRIVGNYAFKRETSENELTLQFGDGLWQLGEGAFSGNAGLESIELPGAVRTVGAAAFEGCSSLSGTIVFPASLIEVGAMAFSSSGVEYVDILGNPVLGEKCFASTPIREINGAIKAVGKETFSGCKSLTSVSLPADMSVLPYKLFAECESLRTVTLPDTVTEIESFAFYLSGIESIVLPQNVTAINRSTFEGCSLLTSVSFDGNRLINVGESAFALCAKLSNIDLPDSVQVIGDYAFKGSGLTSFTTPASLKSIGWRVFYQVEYAAPKNTKAFVGGGIETVPKVALPVLSTITISKDTGCIAFSDMGTFDGSKVTSFEVEDGNEFYSSVDGILYSADRTRLIMYIRDAAVSGINLPEGLREISDGTFYSNIYLYHVTLPSTLEVVGNYAFYNCINLQSVTFPSKLVTIGNYSFAGSTVNKSNLSQIVFAPDSSVVSIGESAFSYNKGLVSVELPSSLVTIGKKAFYSAYNLKEVDFSAAESLTRIGDSAFSGDAMLAPQIESLDFSGCSSLVGTGQRAFANCEMLSSIIFGNLTKIDTGSFAGCTSLVEVVIGSRISEIGSSAFRNCTSLSSITVSEQNELSVIGSYAFAGTITKNVNYESLDLTDATSLTVIDDYAFSYASLQSVVLPDASFKLGEDVFTGNVKLSKVDLGEGITTIGENVFRYCEALTQIDIPSSVTTIEKEAFSGLNLTVVNIGNRVDGNSLFNMGKNVFFECLSLTTVNIYGDNVPQLAGNEDNMSFHCFINASLFVTVLPNLSIYVESGTKGEYVDNGFGWEVYKDIIFERN